VAFVDRLNVAEEVLVAACGTWPSPIAAAELAVAAVGLDHVAARDGRLTWVESRPSDGGRIAVVELDPARGRIERSPPGFNVRSRVHEYGGLAYLVLGRSLVFTHFDDQRVYWQRDGEAPRPITPPGYRYADFAPAPDSAGALCVREDHTGGGEPVNTIVLLRPEQPSPGKVLFSGTDFVAYPRASADGRWLAWIAWNHPDMPWDATTLRVGRFDGGALHDVREIAGGPAESVLEPRWDRDGSLYFLSDRGDFWQLHRWRGGAIEPVGALAADGGGPLWALGAATYALTGDGRAVMRIARPVDDEIVVVDLATGRATPLGLPFAQFQSIAALGDGRGAAVAVATDDTPALITFDLAGGSHRVEHRPGALALPAGIVARGEAIEFPTAPDDDGARTAHAYYYPPTNPGFRAPAGAAPPLLVQMHGGPTSHARRGFAIGRHYWTSRGFAVVDVNYGGSSGFGRRYRDRLRGNWGVVDVADAVAAVDYLVATGRAARDKVAIRGSSAGGYSTLAALAFTERFSAGANYFGISDIEALARDTHKFESRYLDRLIAPLPQGLATYRARSPLYHLERFARPLITLQGAEDQVVPPAQSRAIVAALRSRGVPVAYLEFEGEQHGFRRAASIVRAHEAELYFYGRIFGFAPADRIEPVPIDNLDPPAPAGC